MTFVKRAVLLLLAVCLWGGLGLHSAGAAENQLLNAAEQELADGFYQRAEADLAEFIQKNPGSPRLLEAILYRAEALTKLGNYDGALKLLSAYESQSSSLADWYLLCRGEALLAKGDYSNAETDFARLIKQFPTSPHAMTAIVNAAVARSRLAQWPQVVELLGQTNGTFQQVARTNHASSDVIRGYLLLSEAQLAQKDTRAAEASLQSLAQSPLDATNNWQRQYLLCRVLLADGRLETALQNATNLLLLADATGQRTFQAQSLAFQAGLMETAGSNDVALAIYRKNLTPGTPTDRQRQALLKVTELSLVLGKPAEAVDTLEGFLAQFPTNSCADLALLTLGELRLRQFEASQRTNRAVPGVTNSAVAANSLTQAIQTFETFKRNYPQDPLLGKAESNLGWCYWLAGELTNDPAFYQRAETAFQRAVTLLPVSPDQASALFKLADAQVRLTNYTQAVATYNTLVERYADVPEVRTNLCEHALFQMLHASLAAQDLDSATNALTRLLAWFPRGDYTDRVLLTDEQIGQRYPKVARALYLDFERGATNSPLLPKLQLAVAHTYEGENRWDDAIREYDAWVAAHAGHPALSRAEYLRAWANYQGGRDTNAFVLFTNFVGRFPTDTYAPLAQWWVADFLSNMGNVQEAEINYKNIFQKWPASRLAYQARMMAGRMAVLRQDWEHAPDYFLGLVNDPTCPPELRGQALFAYGDTLISRDAPNKTADYRDALSTFDLICNSYPTNEIGALAWGQKALCLLQLAVVAQDYALITNSFQQVIDSPAAGVTARSMAEVGLGLTLEKIADSRNEPERTELLKAAMDHYTRVFYDRKFLRTEKGEEPDRFWTRKAGLEAGRLAERLQLREQAINVYSRLQEMIPALHFEEKIKALRAQG